MKLRNALAMAGLVAGLTGGVATAASASTPVTPDLPGISPAADLPGFASPEAWFGRPSWFGHREASTFTVSDIDGVLVTLAYVSRGEVIETGGHAYRVVGTHEVGGGAEIIRLQPGLPVSDWNKVVTFTRL